MENVLGMELCQFYSTCFVIMASRAIFSIIRSKCMPKFQHIGYILKNEPH